MRTLISVSDKTGLADFARQLPGEIIATGGTAKFLCQQGIKVMEISRLTGFPEMLDGRVKTLHPQVQAGILALPDKQKKEIKKHKIKPIDLVVVNLYPFEKKPNIENIDIGGPTLIRAAAKNYKFVTVVVDPRDYPVVLSNMRSLAFRKKMAAKAWQYIAYYDFLIANYFSPTGFNEYLLLGYKKLFDLRYGENPHQKAAFYGQPRQRVSAGQPWAKQVQGKELSFNNILDADVALELLKEFKEPTAVIIKHNNPCGVATDKNIDQAFKKAYTADPLSAFGGIIALNRPCSQEIAALIGRFFCEVVLAPKFTSAARQILKQKKNLRLLEVKIKEFQSFRVSEFKGLKRVSEFKGLMDIKKVFGGILVQDLDRQELKKIKTVTQRKPTKKELDDLLFAWKVCQHVKSNAIVIAKNKTTIGLGIGQTARIKSVELALKQAGQKAKNAVLASDGFFPFADSIQQAAKYKIKAIIQPGGSIKDNEVISTGDKYKMAMIFTGQRAFKH